jgi:hypothetical protein
MNMTADALRALRDRYEPGPRIFVESGTWHGRTTLMALALFDWVHTIEVSLELHRQYGPALRAAGAICYRGDSAIVVPILARELIGPVFWYLDAHWTEKRAGAVRVGFPLWTELAAIAARGSAGDVVVVDDAHCFGRADPQPEWLGVSLDSIAALFTRHREATLLGDQAVVYL